MYTGIDGVNKNDIRIYPNPATEVINVEGLDMQKVTIMNYHGQIVYENKNPLLNNSINIEQFISGIYILKIETSNGLQIKKIVIE